MREEEKILGKNFKSLLEEKDELDVLESLEGGQDIEDAGESTTGHHEDAEREAENIKPLKVVVIDDVELLLAFIQESQDHLRNIEEKILKLEESNDTAVVNSIFRSMHTLKGNSAFFGFEKIKELSHAFESVLDDIRGDRIDISPELVDILLEGKDLLISMIDELGKVVSLSEGSKGTLEIADSEVEISPILSRIQRISNPSEGDPGIEELVTDEMVEKFISESRDLLDDVEKDILEMEKSPAARELLDEAFRCIHTIKGNAGFLGYADLEKTCMEMESVLDSIRSGRRKTSDKVVTILLNTVDSMRRILDFMQDEESGGGEAAEPAQTGQEEYRPIGEILVEMGEATPEVVGHALDMQDKKVGEILVTEGAVSEQALEKALQSQGKAVSLEQGGAPAYAVERKDIRVDMWKLDKLFDLMGELITAEAMVIHNPELEDQKLESFNRAAVYLSKITREMQEITMTVRMIPLEGLFNKMRRLVRDLSRKFGKKINLSVSGQETEMDRNVIEEISDPLIHIIRNAIDHGIEDENSRRSQGKEEAGSLSLSARYEGNEIWIAVKDDGAGLRREKILAKAQQRGLLKGEPESLADDEVWQLIFEPGFSTAEKVSEISGRGVGMDVVNKNMERLRGKIDIRSAPVEGTEITLKIPLTLAIMDGIAVKVGDILYALALEDILEFHKTTEEQITRTDTHREVFRLREEIIPVIKLHEFFKARVDKKAISDGILIITQAGGRKAALLVDDIVGYQQFVVKALPEYIADMKAISGCSIMGNGEVSLIIDAGSLLKDKLE